DIKCEKILYEQLPYENIKYQILFNYIPKISKNSDVSNALGKLYYFIKEDGKHIRLINFEINYQKILIFKITTFYPMNKDYEKAKSIIFFHHITKKVLDKDGDGMRKYSEKSFKNASVNFLSIENLEKFKKSKCYYIKRLFDDIKKYLGDYLDFEFLPYLNEQNKNLDKEFNDYEKIKNYKHKNESVKELFKGYKLIINNLEDEAGKPLEFKLKESLSSLFNPNANKILNLNIVYSKDYYKDNDLQDKYKASVNTQHICIDEISINNQQEYDKTLDKITQELLIRKDLVEKRISLINYKEEQNIEIIYIYKQDKKYEFFSMYIYKNAKFDFLATDSYTKDVLIDFINQKIKYPDEPKLAIKIGNKLSLISRTELKILPDVRSIYEKLEEDARYVSKIQLERVFHELEEKEKLLDWLEDQKYEISIKDIRKGIKKTLGLTHKHNSKEYKNIEEVFAKYDIALEPHLRDNSSKDFYNGHNHFFTFMLDDILYYSVGNSVNLDSTFSNAANCYRLDGIYFDGSLLGALEPIDIDMIAKMCSINYVKSNQNSVLPWANKYIKEYLKSISLFK
ncbi:hypothetical protein, partial [Campylobacter sp. 2018MI27]|uniref:hypothetical protein n=1 Tax=Campylobacter sp. 2018MI27 TaxID=2836738 RepID=UPI001BD93906